MRNANGLPSLASASDVLQTASLKKYAVEHEEEEEEEVDLGWEYDEELMHSSSIVVDSGFAWRKTCLATSGLGVLLSFCLFVEVSLGAAWTPPEHVASSSVDVPERGINSPHVSDSTRQLVHDLAKLSKKRASQTTPLPAFDEERFLREHSSRCRSRVDSKNNEKSEYPNCHYYYEQHLQSEADKIEPGKVGKLEMRRLQLDPEKVKIKKFTRKATPEEAADSGADKKEVTELLWDFDLLQQHVSLQPPSETSEQPDQPDVPFCSEHQGEHCEWFMVNEVVDVTALPGVHLVDFQPVITRYEGATPEGSTAHHIDIFACSGDVAARYPPVTRVVPAFLGAASEKHACDFLLYAYDRGAGGLAMPDVAGMRVGEGTPYSALLVQWHYILPYGGVKGLRMGADPADPSRRLPFVDKSGIRIRATPSLRPYSAGNIALIKMLDKFDTGSPAFHRSLLTSDEAMESVLGHDWDMYGGHVQPVAVHMHMHDHGVRMWAETMRGGAPYSDGSGSDADLDHDADHGVVVGETGRLQSYEGYGRDEGFYSLMPLDADDYAASNATSDFPPHSHSRVRDGVWWKDEGGPKAWQGPMGWSWAWDGTHIRPPSSPTDPLWAYRDPSRRAAWRKSQRSQSLRGADMELTTAEAEQPHFIPNAIADKQSRAQKVRGAYSSAPALRRGDRVRLNCVMNTRDGTAFSRPPAEGATTIHTGMDKGQEMCGMILMYYPHDPTVRYSAGGMIANMHQEEVGIKSAVKAGGCYELNLDDGSCKLKDQPAGSWGVGAV